MPRPALFLDRDGVVIDDTHYVGSVDQIRWIPGSAAAVRKANVAGYAIVVVSNQSGVARGLFSEAEVDAINDHIRKHFLNESGATFDRVFFCPHHPTEGVAQFVVDCECRKPKAGMILRGAKELGIDLNQSWMIGDRISDIEAGSAAGCRTILVRTGYGKNVELSEGSASLVCANLAEAVDLVLSTRSTTSPC